MLRNRNILLLASLILGVLIYTIFRDELRAAIEFATVPLIAQKNVSPSENANAVEPWLNLKLRKKYSGFNQPVYLTHSGDGSGRIFILEKEGKIISLSDGIPSTFMDIDDRIRSRESERGLLGLAFHPDFKSNSKFYVYYTDLRGDVVISEFKTDESGKYGNKESERVLLRINQPFSNHNGGQIEFGPDGYLYIGTGDGGGGGDPFDNGQNINSLLGKILRIDVNSGSPYGIPSDNPFVNKSGRDEIWSYGLRNPWRFSFDTKAGDLYISDVGQRKWEEINFQPARSKGGENYGWRYLEGFNSFKLEKNIDLKELTMPVFEYGHEDGCSVTGGYIYRGREHPNMTGTYFLGDFCTGIIWGLKGKNNKWVFSKLLKKPIFISSFGTDENGEIYVLDFKSGYVYQLVSD